MPPCKLKASDVFNWLLLASVVSAGLLWAHNEVAALVDLEGALSTSAQGMFDRGSCGKCEAQKSVSHLHKSFIFNFVI